MKAALIALEFDVEGRMVSVTPTGSGNVNDTFIAIFRTTFSEFRFIIQKLNTKVFPSPEAVMHNMKLITEHIQKRLEAECEDSDRIWQIPRIIPTKDGRDFLYDDEGGCWRAISLIASATAYEEIQNLEHAQESGFVLGQFQRLLSDVPVEQLKDTLPGFHVTPGYLPGYDAALASDDGQKLLKTSSTAKHCCTFVDEHREWCDILEAAQRSGELKLRPIHGDPKVANIMIDDATGKGTCVIDLDTVKPGLIQYDFGDCLRSCCNPAGEDAKKLSNVIFDTELCESIVRGYMKFAREFLTDADRGYMYESIRLLTFELGLRFFADYLAGDVYFKVRREGQNLQRARVQFKLCESIETRESVIRGIIDKYQ